MNESYDQIPDLVEDGFQWDRGTVYALLFDGAVFDPTDKRVSDVGRWIKREPLQNRYVNTDGDWCGNPAVFYMVSPDTEYQLVLAYDDGRNDEQVLSFFDVNVDGSPIRVERRGSLFVRPYTPDGEDPPSYSIWLRPEQA